MMPSRLVYTFSDRIQREDDKAHKRQRVAPTGEAGEAGAHASRKDVESFKSSLEGAYKIPIEVTQESKDPSAGSPAKGEP